MFFLLTRTEFMVIWIPYPPNIGSNHNHQQHKAKGWIIMMGEGFSGLLLVGSSGSLQEPNKASQTRWALPIDKMLYIYLLCPQSRTTKKNPIPI
jgi:hypothetical protein